ncbi:hypothetical protein E2C01_092176 [Portunus trituberculatus]|uniref:Uncharacterized protein n=1 Tax=Portunus trituberculatus TaxID=210409 RepID=A0A5B7JRB6_PORTR|nr:hypothetical protein [Portunus trituberculatus]
MHYRVRGACLYASLPPDALYYLTQTPPSAPYTRLLHHASSSAPSTPGLTQTYPQTTWLSVPFILARDYYCGSHHVTHRGTP